MILGTKIDYKTPEAHFHAVPHKVTTLEKKNVSKLTSESMLIS